jgi:hypothetical protein
MTRSTLQHPAGQPPGGGDGGAQLGFLVGLEIANANERPAWKKGDFFERTFGRKRAETSASH